SRRRHTRCYRDWSSDVCSSDLDQQRALDTNESANTVKPEESVHLLRSGLRISALAFYHGAANRKIGPKFIPQHIDISDLYSLSQIGRASCRERVLISLGVHALL